MAGGYILVRMGTKTIPRTCAIAVPLPIITIPLRRGSVKNRETILVRSELIYVFSSDDEFFAGDQVLCSLITH